MNFIDFMDHDIAPVYIGNVISAGPPFLSGSINFSLSQGYHLFSPSIVFDMALPFCAFAILENSIKDDLPALHHKLGWK